MRCAVLTEGRYLSQAQPAGLVRALRADGVCVTVSDPTDRPLDAGSRAWLDGIDLVVARGRSPDLLARLGMAEAAGVATVNRRRAIAAVLDKAQQAIQLLAANIPTPRTWIGSIEQLRWHLPPDAFPVIVKPVAGDNARGIAVADTPAALEALRWGEPCAIAQSLLPSDGHDIKLYVAGDDVWAVRKLSPLRGPARDATPLAVAPSWRDLALRCGAVFGLDLYGVDCIETAAGLQVIEVNDFPNYTGVDEADALLARHVKRHVPARRVS